MFNNDIYQSLGNKDLKLQNIIDLCGIPKPKKRELSFFSFVRIIINQQLSTTAAKKILIRLETTLGKNLNNYHEQQKDIILKCGVSKQKAEYIINIASIFRTEKNFLVNLSALDETEIINRLIQIKGLGLWSANIFCLFYLQKENIFVRDDLAIKKAVLELYQLSDSNYLVKVAKLMKKWHPYNSYVCLLLWHYMDFKKTNKR